MTDQPDVPPNAKKDESARGAQQEASAGDNIQSLTDFFDQMDRAAFKRALANRDAHRDALQEAAAPQDSKRR